VDSHRGHPIRSRLPGRRPLADGNRATTGSSDRTSGFPAAANPVL